MANTKITTNVIADGAITSAKLDSSSLSIPSTATATTQSAGDNSTKVATTAYVETAVSNLVSAAPAALDTLDELAAALGDDANFSTTITNSLALKAPLASPDFTGDVTFDTSTLVVDSTNNRVGIGQPNPAQKLDVQGIAKIQNSGADSVLQIFAPSDSYNPHIHFAVSGIRDSGVLGYENGDDALRYRSGASSMTTGTERFCIEAGGNVGIGATNPAAKLEIETSSAGSTQTKAALLDVNLTNNIGSGYLEIHTGTGSTAKTQIEQVAGGAGGFYGTYQDTNIINTTSSAIVAGNINFVTGGAIRMTVGGGSQAGNVGIGTDNPSSILHLYADDPQIILDDSNTSSQSSITGQSGNILYKTSSVNRDHVFYGVNTEAARITGDGNVGIGATNPSSSLHISQSSPAITLTDSDAAGINTLISGSSGRLTFDADVDDYGTGEIIFKQAGSERMRIDSSGNLIIGSSGTLPSSSQGGAAFRPSSNERTILELATALSSNQVLQQFINTNGVVGQIATNGSATNYNTSSDYRLKENVVDMEGALDRVNQLQPKRFNFIADADTTVDGFLAHEVASVVPEAISGEKDAVDDEDNPIYQGIDQSKLVPLLVKAVQELSVKVDTLEAEIEVLRNG